MLMDANLRPVGQTFGIEDARRQDARVDELRAQMSEAMLARDPTIQGLLTGIDSLATSDATRSAVESIRPDLQRALLLGTLDTTSKAVADHLGVPESQLWEGSTAYWSVANQARQMRAERDSVNAARRDARLQRRQAEQQAREEGFNKRMAAEHPRGLDKFAEIRLLKRWLGIS